MVLLLSLTAKIRSARTPEIGSSMTAIRWTCAVSVTSTSSISHLYRQQPDGPRVRVLVFTPTARPGFDVTLASLKRQTYRDFDWALGDDLYKERYDLVESFVATESFNCYHFDTSERKPGEERSLVTAYNKALAYARDHSYDLFISLQDYIWVPENGIELFVQSARKHPSDLMTGLCSHSGDPMPEDVFYPDGLYTVFGTPYTRKPETIVWKDVRADNYPGYKGIVQSNPIEFEWNWAAIPRGVLLQDIWVDEDYGAGIGYENQAFAYECLGVGSRVLLDLDNYSIALPHNAYALGRGAPTDEYNQFCNQINRKVHFPKWEPHMNHPDFDPSLEPHRALLENS